MKRASGSTADRNSVERDVDEQVRRLRRMLVLMAPETGTSAFGARITAVSETARDQRVLALPYYPH